VWYDRRLVSLEHEQRCRRILADFEQRPGGDYAELLRRGQVVSPPGVDIEAWRAEIHAKARADKSRVATIRDGEVAIAIRQREYSDAESAPSSNVANVCGNSQLRRASSVTSC
jgi:hypothetical protein